MTKIKYPGKSRDYPVRFAKLALVSALVSAFSAHAVSITQVMPSHAPNQYALKRSDGGIFFWGSQAYLDAFMPDAGASVCNDTYNGMTNWCAWKGITSTTANSVTRGLLGTGLMTDTQVGSVNGVAEKIVGSMYSSANINAQAHWWINAGKVYFTSKNVSLGPSRFQGVSPSGGSTSSQEITAITAMGSVTDAIVSVHGSTPLGIYFVTSDGNLYYYGKKPTQINIGTDVIPNDTIAATTPVLIATNVSSVFASKYKTTAFRLGYVDTSGTAWVFDNATSATPSNFSVGAGVGTVTKVYSTSSAFSSTPNFSTIFVGGNGVFAEIHSNARVLKYTGTANTATQDKTMWSSASTDNVPYQVQGIAAADVANGIHWGQSSAGSFTQAFYLDAQGQLKGFGGSSVGGVSPLSVSVYSDSTTPSTVGILTPVKVLMVDPSWALGNFVASRDTVAQAIRVSWTPPAAASGIKLYRSSTAPVAGSTLPTGELIATLAGTATSFDDPRSDVNDYWYTAYAETADGKTSVVSATATPGRANLPPTSVTATGHTQSGKSISMTPVITDPNAGDTFTLSVSSSPSQGTAEIVANKVVYTSTNANFAGSDTFAITATDAAGNATPGTVTVSVSCSNPIITAQTQDPITEWGRGGLQVSFSAQACHTNLQAKLELFDPVTNEVVVSHQTGNLGVGTNVNLTFPLKDLQAKNFPARITFSSEEVPSLAIDLEDPIAVAKTTETTYVAAKSNWSEDELMSLAVRMPTVTNCPLTTSQSLAESNNAYCLVEPTQVPLGLAQDEITSELLLTGYGAPAANTGFGYKVSKWDSLGTRHVLEDKLVTLSVLETVAPTFELYSTQNAASVAVKSLQDLVTFNLRQTSGTNCPVYFDSTLAQIDLVKGKRVCLAQVTTPTEASWSADGAGTTFKGRFNRGVAGTKTASYTVDRQYANKPAVQVSAGSLSFTVEDMAMQPAFVALADNNTPVRGVDVVHVSAQQTQGVPCTLTSNLANAKASWMVSGMPQCLVTWRNVAPGLAASGAGLAGVLENLGTQGAAATVQILDTAGNVQFTQDVTVSVDASSGTGPAFSFLGNEIVPGFYAANASGVLGTVTVGDDTLGAVNLSFTPGTAAPIVYSNLTKNAKRNIAAATGELWSVSNMVVQSSWKDYPSVTMSRTYKAVVIPPQDMAADMSVARTVLSTQPVTFDVSVGQNGRFSASTMGSWTGYIGSLQADGTVQALTSAVDLTAGKAKISYPNPSELNGVQVVFVASVQSGLAGYAHKLQTVPVRLSMVDGSGIESTVTSPVASGVAPLLVRMSTVYDSIKSKLMGGISWKISNDGGANWTAPPRATGTVLSYEFTEPGNYLIKTEVKNRFSGVIESSEPVSLRVYPAPAMSVSGRTTVRATENTNLRITAEGATAVKWVLTQKDGTTQEVAGADLAVTSPLPTTVTATAMATMASAEQQSDAAAWKTISQRVSFVALSPVRVAISGPRQLEDGKTGVFKASIKANWEAEEAGHTFAGEWTLPDGTKVSGMDLSWTPTLADVENKAVPSFRAFVEGYETLTAANASPRMTLLHYAFPDWQLVTKYDTLMAPALVRFNVGATRAELDSVRSVKEKITYAWSIPENADGKASGGALTFVANTPGNYPVEVTVTDTRGNTRTMSGSVNVIPPSNVEASLRIDASNTFVRVPVTLSFRPQFSGGHYKERLEEFRLLKNGELMASGKTARFKLTLDEPGEYSFEVQADTSFGRTFSATKQVSVVANQPPTCNLDHKVNQFSNTALVTANCSDRDGKMKAYAWTVNGAPSTGANFRLSVPIGAVVQMTATDDSGATVTTGTTAD